MEFVLKVIGFGWLEYWADSWNRLDFFNVVASTLDVAAILLESSFISLFKVLRARKLFRLLRITRMVKMLKVMRGISHLVTAVYKSLGAMAQVAALLLLVVFVYAYMGVLSFGTVMHGCDFDLNVLVCTHLAAVSCNAHWIHCSRVCKHAKQSILLWENPDC